MKTIKITLLITLSFFFFSFESNLKPTDAELFQTRFGTKPENYDGLKTMLIGVLNGAEPIKHKINYK